MSKKVLLNDVGVVAANVYFTGSCDLACTYCFQPKIKSHMKETNDKIIEWISSGKMAKDILEVFGPRTTDIAFWGGEPSMNLRPLVPVLEDYYKYFPELKQFSWSSNFASERSLESTKEFTDRVIELNLKYNHPVKIDLQISIDGVPEINDKNRIGSSADRISEHTTAFVKWVNEDPLRIETLPNIHFKGTQSAESLSWLNTGDNLLKHYKYFDHMRAGWEEAGYKVFPRGAEVLTFVYPGNYTQKDGYVLKEITEKLYSEEFQHQKWECSYPPSFDTQVSGRVYSLWDFLSRGIKKTDTYELLGHTTCSAGRSCIGLDYKGKIHWCQGTYFFDDETQDYIEKNDLVTDFEAKQGFSFRNFDKYINDIIVTDVKENPLLTDRSLSIARGFAKNFSLKDQYWDLMIGELASAGLISPCFKEDKWKQLAKMYFLFSGACPVDNVWEFGSIWTTSTSQVKLILNGAFEMILDHYRRNVYK